MSNKHEANVRKSTLVNFQIGLIASLLFTFVMFEMYTSVSVVEQQPYIGSTDPDEKEYSFEIFREESKPKKQLVVKTKITKNVDLTKIKVGEKETALTDLKVEIEEGIVAGKTDAPPVDSIIDVGMEENIVYDIDKVTVAPIYPGCEKYTSNDERIACFSSKLRTIVSRKFNADLGAAYGLKGLQKIHVQFQVDTNGTINDIRVRAPHPRLEREARRVVKKLSNMEPGSVGGEPVKVKYLLPITFKIQD